MSGHRAAARGAELDRALDGILSAAGDGSGACLIVEGAGSDGAVTDAAAVAAVRRGFDARIVVGSLTGAVPFAAIAALLRQRPEQPGAAMPAGVGLDLPSLRALAERFDVAAVDAPLLLAVDDAAALDAASARVLAYLAGNLDARRLAVVLVTDEVGAGSWLQELVTVHGAGLVSLEGRSGGAEPSPAQHEVLATSSGPVRRVIEALAVLGGSPTLAAIGAVAGEPAEVVLPVLDELFEAGLLRPAASGVGQLLDAPRVLGSVPPSRASQLHDRAARHHRAVGAPVEVIAHHVRHGAPGSHTWSVELLRTAADRALEVGDASSAVAWLQRAIEEPGAESVPPSADLLIQLASAQARAGDPSAVDTLRRAIERSGGAQRRRLQVQLARQMAVAGRVEDAVDVLDGAEADLRPSEPGYDRALLEIRTAAAATCRSSLPLRHRSASLLRQLTGAVADGGADDPSVLAELAYEHSLAGTDRDVVLDLGRRAAPAVGRGEGDPAHAHGLFLALVWSEDHDAARALLDRLHTDPRTRPVEAHRRGTLALAAGDLDRAVAWSRVAATDVGWVAPVLIPGARAQLARALLRQGDLDGAEAALELPGGTARWRRHATYHPVLLANAELAAARGDWRRALAFADDCATFAEAMGTYNPAVVPWHVVAARARVELGEPETARQLLDDALARAVAFGAPRVVAELRAQREQLDEPAPSATAAEPADAVAPAADDVAERPRLRLLGDTVLRIGGTERRLGDDLVDRAVCILAVADRGVHDEELAESLWPEGDPNVGRTRLRNVLMRVRQRFGPVVERHGRTVRLSGQVDVDLRRFRALAEDALSSADPATAEDAGARALELYRGDLCPAHPFDPWAAAPRAAAQHRRLTVLDRLSELAAARGDLNASMSYFEDAVAAEPWNEDRYLDAADRLLRGGRPAAARSLLRRSEAMCRELGVPPSRRHRDLESAVG